MRFKRANIGLAVVLVVIIVAIFLGWLVNLGSKECRSNTDCGNEFYCGSDFACHQIPVIEKTIVQNNLILPSIIIGIAIVTAALILKWNKLPLKNKLAFGKKEEPDEKDFTQKLKTP